jgi:hypothetical protein
VVTGTYAESSSLSPHYAELAAAIESLSGADARLGHQPLNLVRINGAVSLQVFDFL